MEKIKKLKEKLSNRIERKNSIRTGKNVKSSCLMFVIIFLMVFIFIFVLLVVKTGAARVPILSKAFYQKPQPTRVISIEPGYKEEGGVFSDKTTFILKIPEKSLTFTLREEFINKSPNAFFRPDIQIVITPNELEFYSSLVKPSDMAIIFGIKPEISNEKIDFKITKLRIGSLNIHPNIADFVIRKILGRKVTPNLQKNIMEKLNMLADINSFEMSEGMINFSLVMKIKPNTEGSDLTEEQLKSLENIDLTEEKINILKEQLKSKNLQ